MELKKHYTIDDLLEIMEILRSDKGCPWDREQTHESIRKSLIEECYETIDALEKQDDAAFSNELGDVLLQVVFHSQIAKERGAFCFDDVLYELCNKLITRHTHVFGADAAATAEEALGSWEKNKKKEKNLKRYTDMLLDVPQGFPALMRAQKIQKKAAAVGFDWDNIEDVKAKVREELAEVDNAKTEAEIKEEIGDLLFAVVNLARFYKVDSEEALSDASRKFITRFDLMEKACEEENLDFQELNLEEKDKIWDKIKKKS